MNIDLNTPAGMAAAICYVREMAKDPGHDVDLRKQLEKQIVAHGLDQGEDWLNPVNLTIDDLDDREWLRLPEPTSPQSPIEIYDIEGNHVGLIVWEDGDPGDDSVGLDGTPGFYRYMTIDEIRMEANG